MKDDTVTALELEDLSVAYRVGGENKAVLRNVSLSIGRGEAYGLVGESGCGKSTVAFTLARYLPPNGSMVGGHIRLDGQDVMALDNEELRHMRAERLSMVYQDPGKALNPSIRIGRQLTEVYEIGGASRDEAAARAHEILEKVQISDPARIIRSYPHQLSGGMQQRVGIAMALASNPSMLILDEPTTGLDATVEAEVLDLIATLRREFSISILFISHNLAIVSRMCDRVGVLYAGMLVEEGATDEIFTDPRHPYTAALLRCLPGEGRRKGGGALDTIPGFLPGLGDIGSGCAFADRCALVGERCRAERPKLYELGHRLSRCYFHHQVQTATGSAATVPVETASEPPGKPVLRVQGLNKTYGLKGGAGVVAVKDLSLELPAGQTLGLVGESGSGKTSFARTLLGLVEPDDGGRIELDGKGLPARLGDRSFEQTKLLQIIFQNPDSALNRAHSVRSLIGRALKRLGGFQGAGMARRMDEIAEAVRLTDHHLSVSPRQLSGGLKQRVAIARAFAGDPRVVVCDEPTSALDVSVQAAILNLLVELQAQRGVSYIFISHDLGVVRYLSDQVLVLYLGRVMEYGPSEDVFSGPQHPYTEALLSAASDLGGPEAERIRLEGEIPSAANPPSGCAFHTRCARRIGKICDEVDPPLTMAGTGHAIRCHIPADELARLQGGEPACCAAQPASREHGDDRA